jgi:hypothetical protein
MGHGMLILRFVLPGCLWALAAFGLQGCVPTTGGSINPDFAGSMKSPPGLFEPPKPLGELPGSRVREGN